MDIKECTDKKEWNQFIENHGPTSGAFLHSWEWGVFQESLGRQVWRFVILEGEVPVGVFVFYKHGLPAGQVYLYCPRGPIFKKYSEENYTKFFEFAKVFAKEQGAAFVRFELFDNPPDLVKYNLKKVANIQPADTTVIDLSKDKDNLLAAMHHKTRYNIRLAGRKGVEINSLGMHCLDEFWRLMSQTTARDKFRAHPKDYYEKIIQAMGEASDAKAWFGTAYYNNRLAAVNLMVSFGKTVTYLHGASADKYRNVMAPHLLQWEMIKKAKFAGKKWYDFWGVAPEGIEDHPWAGVTRFKKGFSGQELHYGGTFDLVVSPVKYRVYSLVRYLKK